MCWERLAYSRHCCRAVLAGMLGFLTLPRWAFRALSGGWACAIGDEHGKCYGDCQGGQWRRVSGGALTGPAGVLVTGCCGAFIVPTGLGQVYPPVCWIRDAPGLRFLLGLFGEAGGLPWCCAVCEVISGGGPKVWWHRQTGGL